MSHSPPLSLHADEEPTHEEGEALVLPQDVPTPATDLSAPLSPTPPSPPHPGEALPPPQQSDQPRRDCHETTSDTSERASTARAGCSRAESTSLESTNLSGDDRDPIVDEGEGPHGADDGEWRASTPTTTPTRTDTTARPDAADTPSLSPSLSSTPGESPPLPDSAVPSIGVGHTPPPPPPPTEAAAPCGNSFPRVMDISELIRMGSRSRPDAEGEDETEVRPAPPQQAEEGSEPLPPPSPPQPPSPHWEEPPPPTAEETVQTGNDVDEDDKDDNRQDEEPLTRAAAEVTSETEPDACNVAQGASTSPPDPSPPAPPAVVPPPTAPAPVALPPTTQPLPPLVPPTTPPPPTPVPALHPGGAVRPVCASYRFAQETARLRRTLLSAFPAPLRRLYTREVWATASSEQSSGGDEDGSSSEGESVGPRESPRRHQRRRDARSGSVGGSTVGNHTGPGTANEPAVMLVAADVVEAGDLASLSAAAVRAESALQCQPSLTVRTSPLPSLPKALPRLLEHLCTDACYVAAAWDRYHDDARFIRAGATVAVRKRRRSSLLGQEAVGEGVPLPTPRTHMAMRDWTASADDAVRAWQRRLTTLGAGPTSASRRTAATVAATATGPETVGATVETGMQRHGQGQRRGPGASGEHSRAGHELLGPATVATAEVGEILSKDEMAMYARYTMSSGKLRQEIGEPFALLTRRAAQQREACLPGKP